MADEYEVDVKYRFDAESAGLVAEQAKIRAALDGTAKSAAGMGDSAADAEKKFHALGNAEKYLNGLKIASNNLKQAVDAFDKSLAADVAHVAGAADGLADAAQSSANFAKATTGAEKAAAGIGLALNVASAALEVYNLAMQRIDKSTNDYVNGAQARHLGGVQGLTRAHEQLNVAMQAGWEGFDKGKSFAENYANALKYLQENGIAGLKTGAADAQIATLSLMDALDDLGLKTEGDVAVQTQMMQRALDELQKTMHLSEEEAVKRLAPAFKTLAQDMQGMTDHEIPQEAAALLDLGKQYDVLGDKAATAGKKQTTAAQDAIAAIRKGLSPANQELLDTMTSLRGATEQSSLAQAENIKWTEEQAKQAVIAKLKVGDYVEASEFMAAGVTDLTKNSKEMSDILKEAGVSIDAEGKAAKTAASSKNDLADSEDAVASSASDASDAVKDSTSSLNDWMNGPDSSSRPPGVPPSGPPGERRGGGGAGPADTGTYAFMSDFASALGPDAEGAFAALDPSLRDAPIDKQIDALMKGMDNLGGGGASRGAITTGGPRMDKRGGGPGQKSHVGGTTIGPNGNFGFFGGGASGPKHGWNSGGSGFGKTPGTEIGGTGIVSGEYGGDLLGSSVGGGGGGGGDESGVDFGRGTGGGGLTVSESGYEHGGPAGDTAVTNMDVYGRADTGSAPSSGVSSGDTSGSSLPAMGGHEPGISPLDGSTFNEGDLGIRGEQARADQQRSADSVNNSEYGKDNAKWKAELLAEFRRMREGFGRM